MEKLFPIVNENRKSGFVQRFEELIISGYFPIGIKLPSERDLAALLEVSRPVVREGLIELQSMGLVSMKSRSGSIVNDYRREGSLALLTAIYKYGKGQPEQGLLTGIMEMRRLFEVECARLAAIHCPSSILVEINDLLAEEEDIPHEDVLSRIESDFRFHHLIALASGNAVYPLQMNSFKPFYINLAGIFYSDSSVISRVRKFHIDLIESIRSGDDIEAQKVMREMLSHGEEQLQIMLKKSQEAFK